MSHRLLWLLVFGFAIPNPLAADDQLACRSVHLQYSTPGAIAFYNEVTVENSAPGTYFCVCGFRRGYFGLQELGDGKKLLIFSVWDDHDGNDPNAVPEELRVDVLYQGEDVRVGRFGNEGTGGQSFYDFDWEVGETYRFLITADLLTERTAYTAWFFHPEEQEWFRMATFSTFAHEYGIRGLYSFVEDFRRDGVSATQMRRANYTNGWVRAADGQWLALMRATFTADDTPVGNIDSGPTDNGFYLQTGGETQQLGAALNDIMDRVPIELPELPEIEPAATTEQ